MPRLKPEPPPIPEGRRQVAPEPEPAPRAPSKRAEPPLEEKPQPASSGVKRFKSKSAIGIYHPFQNVMIPTNAGVPLDVDNWVKVQLDAGVIEEA